MEAKQKASLADVKISQVRLCLWISCIWQRRCCADTFCVYALTFALFSSLALQVSCLPDRGTSILALAMGLPRLANLLHSICLRSFWAKFAGFSMQDEKDSKSKAAKASKEKGVKGEKKTAVVKDKGNKGKAERPKEAKAAKAAKTATKAASSLKSPQDADTPDWPKGPVLPRLLAVGWAKAKN